MRFDIFQQRSKRRFAILAVCYLATFVAQRPLPAADGFAWLTGGALRRELDSPLSVDWSNVILGSTLTNVSHTRRVSVLLDRRVDPSSRLELAVDQVPMAKLFERIAAQQGQGMAVLDSVVFVGPAATAQRLRTISAQLHEAAKDLPQAQQRKLLQRRAWSWDDAATSDELLDELARQAEVKIEDRQRIPYDLLCAADLPPLSWLDRLLLLVAQFETSVEIAPHGATVRLIAWPEQATITRSYPGHGQAAAQAAKWQTQLPAAQIKTEGDKVIVTAAVEEHEQLEQAPGGKTAKRPTPRPGKQVYQLSVDKAPLRKLLAELERKLNVEFVYDEPQIKRAGRSLDELVSFKVNDASLDELLAALLEPAGLTFRRQEQKVQVIPADEKAR